MNSALYKLAWLCLAGALLLPGLAFFPHGQHAFWIAENLMAAVLAPLALGFAVLSQGLRPSQPESRAALGGLVLLMALWALSAASALRRDLSAIELASWLNYPCMLLAVLALLRKPSQASRLLYFVLALGVLQASYALIQASGKDPFPWNTLFGGRVSGFLGNPNFLGGHIALLLPLTLGLALNSRSPQPQQRLLRWCLLAVLGWVLLLTQTRGALLGAGLGCLFTLWLCHRAMPGLLTRNRWVLISLLALSLMAGLAPLLKLPTGASRLSTLFRNDEELGRRLHLMRAAAQMSFQHPLLGVGPGNYRIYFPTVQAVGYSADELLKAPYVYSEHAHNDFIQMAAESGWPSALLLLGLCAWLLAHLLRAIAGLSSRNAVERAQDLGPQSSQSQPLLLAGICGGLLGLWVHGLANFPFLIQPTQLTAWALAGLGLHLSLPPAYGPAKNSHRQRWALGLGLLLAASLAGYRASRDLIKDGLWWMGQGEIEHADSSKGTDIIFKALELDRRDDRLWFQHGKGKMLGDLTWDSAGSLREAVRLNPYMMEAQTYLGEALVRLKEYSEAETVLEKAVKQAPNFPEAWRHFGAALYMQQKFEKAAEAFDQAAKLGYDRAAMLDNKAAALGNLGRFGDAILALEQSAQIEPDRLNNLMNRAVTYHRMGMRESALKALARAKEVSPGNPDVFKMEKDIRGR